VRPEGLGKSKNRNYVIGNGNRDLQACSVVPQPITIQCASLKCHPLCDFDTVRCSEDGMSMDLGNLNRKVIQSGSRPIVNKF
jgi:hypothetical protein